MPKRTLKQTAQAHPEAVPLAPSTRRELSVRRILDKYGDPLDVLAKASQSGDLKAAAALLPYVYPALKAVELSGPGGSAVTVQVVKVGAADTKPAGDTPKPE